MLCVRLPFFLLSKTPLIPPPLYFNNARFISQQQQKFRKTTHCIFDLDGLLLDTEKIYKKSFEETCAIYGKTYTNKILLMHMGTPCEIGCRIIMKALDIKTDLKEFEGNFNRIAHKYLSEAELMPGAQEVVAHLKKYNIPIAIATSSQEPGYSLKTKKHKEFLRNFSHIIKSTEEPEVKKGKPNPDVYLVTASRFKDKPNPKNCLAIEDSPNGVTAAVSAGMQCVMIPDPITPPEVCKHATLVVKCLLAVPFEKFGLPPLAYDSSASISK